MTRIFFPSIVNPSFRGGGAWTVTRELVRLLEEGPLAADVEVIACQRRTGRSRRLRQARAIVASLVSPLPAKVQFTKDAGLRGLVREALASRPFDLVLINGSDLLWLLPDVPPTMQRALIAHNIESKLFEAKVAAAGGGLRPFRRLTNREGRRLHDFELDGLGRVRRVGFLSSANEAYTRTQAPGLRTMTLPPVFGGPPAPRPSARVASPGHLELGMVANFDWWPNVHGLNWFLREVFPGAPGHARLHLYGHGSESVAPSHPRIVSHGFVHDLSEVWSACDFMICPIRTGSGVCVKVAESLYNGAPVLATHKAARGLPITSGPAVALFDQPEEWIRFLHRDAPAFAGETVPVAVSARFHAAAYAEPLATFLGP
ncbi:MAG: glycosyltransferase family 4 protein [Thermoleophilia bacterium]|nr:glycosyltransferase family 4 protein [Thermoleophilia bacterium]